MAMEQVSKETILSKTHYGTNIYAHVLRLYYPNETVLKPRATHSQTRSNPTTVIFLTASEKRSTTKQSHTTAAKTANLSNSPNRAFRLFCRVHPAKFRASFPMPKTAYSAALFSTI